MMYLLSKSIRKSGKSHLRKYMGNGSAKNLSAKLLKYLTETNINKQRLIQKFKDEVLIIDSIFECGNLLQAEMLSSTEY